MNVRAFALLLTSILCFAASVSAGEKRETIRADALYFPTKEEADGVKKIWDEHLVKQYAFLVGSAEPSDYVAAQPVTTFQPPRGKHQGKVLTVALVDRNGEVIAMQVIESTDPKLELAALDTLRRWKFKPARYKQTAVMSAVAVPFEFGK